MFGRIASSTLLLSGTMLLGCVEAPPRYADNPPAPTQPAPPPAAVAPQPAPPAPEKSLLVLMPLNVPVHEEWSSPRCPDLAVTFSGRSEPAHTDPSDTASFQEARQYHDGDYYEIAECFCSKGGDLSDTTKDAADAVTAETAQQFAKTTHMSVYSTSFVENSPLGKYSEIVEVPQSERAIAVTMRTYWRGKCSMRVETMSSVETKLRASQFLASLRDVKLARTQDAGVAPAAAPGTPPDAAQAQKSEAETTTPAPLVAPTTLPPGTVINPPPTMPGPNAP